MIRILELLEYNSIVLHGVLLLNIIIEYYY